MHTCRASPTAQDRQRELYSNRRRFLHTRRRGIRPRVLARSFDGDVQDVCDTLHIEGVILAREAGAGASHVAFPCVGYVYDT